MRDIAKGSPKLGDLRRSTLVLTAAPGAVVDYRVGEAAISAITMGLEDWPVRQMSRVPEPSLQKMLNVTALRAPPVTQTIDGKRSGELPARRFPDWQECPNCGDLRPSSGWMDRPGRAALHCDKCKRGGKPVPVVPARFVSACLRGHLEDFPWYDWIDHHDGCNSLNPRLKISAKGAGLRGLWLSCVVCKAGKSLNDAFNLGKRRSCGGGRPWLPESNSEQCDETRTTIQRGASNIFFPITRTALSIPPWTDEFLGEISEMGIWEDITRTLAKSHEQVEKKLKECAERLSDEIGGSEANWYNKLSSLVDLYRALPDADSVEGQTAQRREEWHQFFLGDPDRAADRTFCVRTEDLPDSFAPWFAIFARVPRLRAVSVFTGFTRLHPQDAGLGAWKVSPSGERPRWLPAIETLGEGIFVALDETRVNAWEARAGVVARAAPLDAELERRHGRDSPYRMTPRRLLVHSLAHAVLEQLALNCGYSAASLSERLYIGEASSPLPMAGFLIYTASAGSEGTLGGLEREGRSERLRHTIASALDAMRWCSSDPLCMDTRLSVSDDANLAACHSCLFVSETSCETFNNGLDRRSLFSPAGEESNDCPGYFDAFPIED